MNEYICLEIFAYLSIFQYLQERLIHQVAPDAKYNGNQVRLFSPDTKTIGRQVSQ